MLGAAVVVLLLIGEGMVAAGVCVERVGCLATDDTGIFTTPQEGVRVALP